MKKIILSADAAKPEWARLLFSRFRILVAAVVLVLSTVVSTAEAQALRNGENFFFYIPDKFGYQMDFKETTKELRLWEYVPKGQSVNRWKEMVTIIHVKNPDSTSALKYAQAMIGQVSKKCAECTGRVLGKRKYEGYQQVFMTADIPVIEGDIKPEWLINVTMKGRDGIYVMIKAWRYEPTKRERDTWMALLQKFYVCDTRRANRQCDLSRFDEEIHILD